MLSVVRAVKIASRCVLPLVVVGLLSACANTANPHSWVGSRDGLNENIYNKDFSI